jgi:DNA-binding MarR family transcriptional regulator
VLSNPWQLVSNANKLYAMPADRARRNRAAPRALTTADRLHSAAIHLLRLLRREDDASGLSAPRLSALSVVVYGGPLTLGQLAAAEQVRPPTMTRLVQALEQGGLVAREPDAVDGRVVRIRATRRGVRAIERGRARRIDVLARRLDALEPRELTMVGDAVAILERLLQLPSRQRPQAG